MALATRCAIWALPLVVGLALGPASALVVYRLGGGDRPPPPEVDAAGADFVQLEWSDVEAAAGGRTEELDLSPSGIRALELDPNANIAPTIEAHGGIYFKSTYNGQVWDGDTSTVWLATRYLCADLGLSNIIRCVDDFANLGTANIFLGGLYRVERVRVLSGLRDPKRTVRSVRVYADQGSSAIVATLHPADYARPFNPYLVEVRDNREQILDIPLSPVGDVDFLQVALGEHDEPWEIHEIEIYARGYVRKATYVSNILDFGRPVAWGELRWSGSKGEKAKVLIQTRSGQDDDPQRYFRYTGRGQEKVEVGRSGYAGLRVGERAGIEYDREHWSFWSAPYEFGDSLGAQVVSPGPRRYLQVQVEIVPQGEDGGEVGHLELRASPPVATGLVGEVWPVEVAAGQTTRFTYVLRPTIHSGDAGFDRLEIRSLSLLGRVLAVRVGDVEVEDPAAQVEPHRLVVSFPRLEAKDSGALVEVDFEAQVLRYGVGFDGRVWDSRHAVEVPQGVDPGDATGEYEGNRVSVATSAKERALLEVGTATAVVTPNRDGVNEEAELGYEILEITGTAQVRVEVWDLAGRRVRLVHEGAEGIGRYERPWDGRDESGRLVPPGIYPYTVSVDADRGEVVKVGLLYVAY